MNAISSATEPQAHSQADDISPTPTALITVDDIDPPRALARNRQEPSA